MLYRSTARVSLTEAGRFFKARRRKNCSCSIDLSCGPAPQRVAKGVKSEFRIGTSWSTSGLLCCRRLRAMTPRTAALSFLDRLRRAAGPRSHTGDTRSKHRHWDSWAEICLTPRKDIDHGLIHTCAIRAIFCCSGASTRQTASEVRLDDLKGERWIAIEEERVPGFKILLTQLLRPADFAPKGFGLERAVVPGTCEKNRPR